MSSFVKDGSRWRLDIQEEKTGKSRAFKVPVEVYSFVQEFAYENGIGKDMMLFGVFERNACCLVCLEKDRDKNCKHPTGYVRPCGGWKGLWKASGLGRT